MKEMLLRVYAPFAAFRWLQAGVYRATSPVIPPSAAWGLVLNLAGIDTRGPDQNGTTTVRADAPSLEIAIGALGSTDTASLYQQLHSYPVGNTSKHLQARAHGAKYHIAPTRREILVGFACVLAVRGDDSILSRVGPGLRGELRSSRYGLPHAGDNNLLIERIEELASVPMCRWYARIEPGDVPASGTCRLTIGVDRRDSSGTTSAIYAPLAQSCEPAPAASWTWVPRAPE